MLLTVFTPTYNRAYTISKLYESLCRQTCPDFEWLIVDDGSTDNTEQLIAGFIDERKINIRYFKKENGGKHTAINLGVRNANGDLFFIVDSDDYLTNDAVEWVKKEFPAIQDERYSGLSGIRISPDGNKIGSKSYFEPIDSDPALVGRYGIYGDMSEIYKTSILRQYPFPEIPNERFCIESYVWLQIGRKYVMRYYYKGIYVCEYLPDGLTASNVRIRMQSPQLSRLCYAFILCNDYDFMQKTKAGIQYWRFALCQASMSFKECIYQVGIKNLVYLPFGALFHSYDLLKYKKYE